MGLRLGSALRKLGPGLVTGAADDDPSGIATYSQTGSEFGVGMLWTVVLTTPLMIAVQLVSARLGWVTRKGLAAAMRDLLPRWAVLAIVLALLVANVFNLGADLSAMAAAARLATGVGDFRVWLVGFGLLSLALQVLLPFPRYSPLLKLLTLSLLAYAGVLASVNVPWREVMRAAVLPRIEWNADFVTTLVAVLGTTISPYLFFWQASQEAEEQRLRDAPPVERMPRRTVRAHLRRIRLDTWAGMIFSNAIAAAIMLATAITLHANGITSIETTAQAAQALQPIAGDRAAMLYSLGVIGTGMLAVPILAGSAAYAVAEAFDWPGSLADEVRMARGFYAVLAAAVLVGIGLGFNDTDPVRELFWAAVINGIISVPIMAVLMVLVSRRALMGDLIPRRRVRIAGWIATVLMAFCALALALTLI